MKVGIFLYDDAEVLDFSGPFEVFSTASRVAGSRLFETLLIAEREEVLARGGFRVRPNCLTGHNPELDLLVVAGGDHRRELANPSALQWIKSTAKSARITASVCTGAFLLAEAGVLSSQRVTTHWEDQAMLKSAYPALCVLEGVRWVDEGTIVTSGGISAGIDMSLHLVRRLAGEELARATAKQMEFDWHSQG